MTSSPVDLFSEPTSYTDAVLLVEGRKMHVNKANLSFYSEFFNTMFNSNFAEKTMPEIKIKKVKYEDFALLLGMIHREKPTSPPLADHKKTEKLLELADRFLMSNVTHLVENYLLPRPLSGRQVPFLADKFIFLADKFRLERLLNACIDALKCLAQIDDIVDCPEYKTLREDTKLKLSEKHKILRDIALARGPSRLRCYAD